MEVIYNLTDRKPFVKALEEITGEKAIYKGVPTCAYKVDYFTVTREGNLEFDDMADSKEIEMVLEQLEQRGFVCEVSDDYKPFENLSTEEDLQNSKTDDVEDFVDGHIDFSIPLEGASKQAIINFVNMIYSKQYLINCSLQRAVLTIREDFLREVESKDVSQITNDEYSGFRIEEDKLVFTYPGVGGDNKFMSYMTLMGMAFAKAKTMRRVQAKIQRPENEKYYMRTWLIRLGLGGKGGAEIRRALLKNLKGHSAFRTQEEIERAKEKYRAKKVCK